MPMRLTVGIHLSAQLLYRREWIAWHHYSLIVYSFQRTHQRQQRRLRVINANRELHQLLTNDRSRKHLHRFRNHLPPFISIPGLHLVDALR